MGSPHSTDDDSCTYSPVPVPPHGAAAACGAPALETLRRSPLILVLRAAAPFRPAESTVASGDQKQAKGRTMRGRRRSAQKYRGAGFSNGAGSGRVLGWTWLWMRAACYHGQWASLVR